VTPQKTLPTLLVLAAFAYACGPRSRSPEADTGNRIVSTSGVASALDVKIANGVDFSFQVTNNTPKSVELMFPSGQTVDFVVTDTLGRPVWRWSEGRMFTQALRSRVLESEESLSHEATWRPDTLHGVFVAVATLRSDNHPLEQRVRFELP
jgi:hypothetical protein